MSRDKLTTAETVYVDDTKPALWRVKYSSSKNLDKRNVTYTLGIKYTVSHRKVQHWTCSKQLRYDTIVYI